MKTTMPAPNHVKPVFATRLLGALVGLSLSACSTIGYYGHIAHGEYAMLSARRPIARVLADPAVDEALKVRLRTAAAARSFASDKLGLPRNRSYTEYADLKRPYATWNVFAAPEFSVDAYEQCYPIVGCLAYRGYFDRARADQEAALLRERALDVWVGGSAAYSTLGWFADPILNTMLRWNDDELAATIFHELAHQRLFVKGGTEFNESFATFVQYEGLRQWRAANGLPGGDDAQSLRDKEFENLVLDTRDRLRGIYASPLADAEKRERKRAEFERLRIDYARLRDTRWDGRGDYDGWIGAELNNAALLPFGLYHRWVDTFARLFAQQGHDWPAFYAAAAQIGSLSPAKRAQALSALQGRSP